MTTIDPEEYLSQSIPPTNLDEIEEQINQFIQQAKKLNLPVVLVTSGGTTVPLEYQTVRYIDNFSAGTRGATSAEYFLDNGYHVIFLHRQFSLQPFTRHYSHTTNCFLDYLGFKDGDEDTIQVTPNVSGKLKTILKKYNTVKEQQRLLEIPFVTVSDYLFILTRATKTLDQLEHNALFYLAAAVSDFFIPSDQMVEHKIQSSKGDLVITLAKVPKFLKPLVKLWASKAFVVSFKLETDPELLIPKCQQSIDRYQHQLVIGNLLTTRKNRVLFVTKDEVEEINLTSEQIDSKLEIESLFVPKLVQMHQTYIKNFESSLKE
ncbi:hypothetical protein CONCODRAFT_78769 [Conidiobolus coronatus NRRL 28638]|uniref:DNA/pantothenate metabolism flavoprotein C-terminal domain-containing protein n=1 Tax=Conidiobolus coronatus (strain ATCC 28846 / CBS 209.66 / NRRL 28638) TaxID=796925 RepID=A0A137P6G1_CONC2|nr:hypothetical protein CONCODRAFT_78769 [Conidiobolus coronatus NRRL 28638]|eukprot:KXN70592.1 hypothetical protein CONCODRAFT_78769 [Conidiobolus coronatus NRRL 28638]